jgi:DNA-binding transcriptional ArsR family regulator
MINCGKGRQLPDIETLSLEERKKALAKFSKGLAHPARIEIIKILANQSTDAKCICGDIVNALPLAQSSVSQHLKILKEAGWIEGTIDGPRVCYCLIGGIMDFYEDLIKGSLMQELATTEMKGKA